MKEEDSVIMEEDCKTKVKIIDPHTAQKAKLNTPHRLLSKSNTCPVILLS